MGMKTKVALGAVVGIVVIGVVSANSGDGGNDNGGNGGGTSAAADKNAGGPGDKAGKADDAAKSDAGDKGASKASQAEQFKAFVAKNGTPKEKDAVAHVLKVQGADQQNDILDSADVYTDFTGGLMGEGSGPSKLIASAFADWKDSKNGLVTVYDANGEIITNGNF
ncbi:MULTISPECIES: hypothetical protein [unclassified Streptomyces]|uniref:Lipoprotein n=1 Tax=Streptomyces sp. NBC_00119 TaxID=2975659 RepID=A0AAU1UDU9_9ACTN|nr:MULTISPECIES: hypothetical protein [unclassified Streptomyces]MCX4644957.1 hypothetical protein [Streptomyces sp. NBC_01446]MCX5326388.1 hypothetical protein [Streptomyces sp. NBC_00120]